MNCLERRILKLTQICNRAVASALIAAIAVGYAIAAYHIPNPWLVGGGVVAFALIVIAFDDERRERYIARFKASYRSARL